MGIIKRNIPVALYILALSLVFPSPAYADSVVESLFCWIGGLSALFVFLLVIFIERKIIARLTELSFRQALRPSLEMNIASTLMGGFVWLIGWMLMVINEWLAIVVIFFSLLTWVYFTNRNSGNRVIVPLVGLSIGLSLACLPFVIHFDFRSGAPSSLYEMLYFTTTILGAFGITIATEMWVAVKRFEPPVAAKLVLACNLWSYGIILPIIAACKYLDAYLNP